MLAALAILAGCGNDPAPSGNDALALRLVIPDANIRKPDVPCSGASAFRFAHPEVPYTIEDSQGRDVASGTLPEGTAEKAFNIDLGEERQPTVCVMMLDVSGVDTLDGHSLVIGDRSPIPIEPNSSLNGVPEAVLR